jgi:hypothetical protein
LYNLRFGGTSLAWGSGRPHGTVDPWSTNAPGGLASKSHEHDPWSLNSASIATGSVSNRSYLANLPARRDRNPADPWSANQVRDVKLSAESGTGTHVRTNGPKAPSILSDTVIVTMAETVTATATTTMIVTVSVTMMRPTVTMMEPILKQAKMTQRHRSRLPSQQPSV